jgi:hypothetical protein
VSLHPTPDVHPPMGHRQVIVLPTDAEAMQVGIIPAQGDLQTVMEVGDAAVTAHQETAPNQRWGLERPHVKLIDFWGWMLSAYRQTSAPRQSSVCSQHECRQLPFCDGLPLRMSIASTRRAAIRR